MQRNAIPPLEPRLQRRYLKMVQGHMHSVPKLAAGMSALPDVSSAFAATQGAWRFLNNEHVSLLALVEPLRNVGLERANAPDGVDFVLLVHDWCKLAFSHPKSDEVQLTHESDVGYELTTALLVSAADGSPLAPMEMHLKTAQGVLSTRPKTRDVSHLEQVLPTMKAALSWGLNKRLLHVIDREADSVDHLRRWEAAGHLYLVRGDSRIVKWQSSSIMTGKIAQQLRQQREFRCLGTALHQGSPAQLWVAETAVVLYRPAKKNVKGVKYSLPGPNLPLRLIVVQLRRGNGQILAEWLLLTNAPANLATSEKLAYCYYWRWRIESLFKLLKSHGQHLESWQQETGIAIARRLLVAAMACVIVWKLQADESPQAQELKTILVRLSGRQTKRKTPHTAPALLAGLWVLLSMLELLEHVDLNRLKRLADKIPYLNTG
jgi:hypothetical protein